MDVESFGRKFCPTKGFAMVLRIGSYHTEMPKANSFPISVEWETNRHSRLIRAAAVMRKFNFRRFEIQLGPDLNMDFFLDE
jgi:hypothetical protein